MPNSLLLVGGVLVGLVAAGTVLSHWFGPKEAVHTPAAPTQPPRTTKTPFADIRTEFGTPATHTSVARGD